MENASPRHLSLKWHFNMQIKIPKRKSRSEMGLLNTLMQEAEREQQLGEAAKIVNDTSKSTAIVSCGSCYGAENEEMKCCNSCQDVKDAYTKKTWKFDPRGIEQCKVELRRFLDSGVAGVESFAKF